ncbi:MAG: ABC transporter permease [Candidatus Eisenbacteria bacterium]
MRDRAALLLYVAAVVCATLLHDVLFLAAALAAAVLFSGRSAPRLAARAARAILIFNAVVTVSYAAISLLRGSFEPVYLLRMNLRVFLMTYLTFFLISRINPFRALSFSPALLYLFTLAYGQIAVFRRLYDDFRLALRSRSPAKIRRRDLYRHAGATGAFLLEKALHDSTEIAQAMRSRGFFSDSR